MTHIPSQLENALKNGKAIPFVGAGVSMSVKNKTDGKSLFPSWKTLLEQAATRLETEGKDNEASIVKAYVKTNRLLDAANEAKQALAANWFNFLKQQFDLNLNPASPKNQTISRVIYSRIPLIQSLLARSVSMELGVFNRYTPGFAKNDGNWVAISQAQPSFPHEG